ncbi:MAG: flippase-like domain-containing protein [Acidobacteria bacterium]|nr:flippase-like domain-containing protein [Acidobacteriota bacterium]
MRRRLRTVAVLALAVGLMAFFLRSADLERVAAAVRDARWDLLGAALVVTCATYVVRAIRWCWLLRPLGDVRFRVALRATVVGFAASAILPGRVGEVLRPYVLARREGLSVSAALATIVLERLLDVLAVLALLGVAVLIGAPGSAAGTGLLGTVRSGAALAGLAAAAAVGAAFVAAGHPDRVARAVERLGAILPARAAGVLTRIASRFIEGLAVVRNRRVLAVAGVWSLVHWAAAAAVVWLVTVAFDIALPVSGAAVLMALTVVGVSLPTPAGIGGYHAAYQVGATLLYGAPDAAAVAAALVLHATSFLPVTVVGVVCMTQEGVHLTAVRSFGGAGAEENRSAAPADESAVAASAAGGRRT